MRTIPEGKTKKKKSTDAKLLVVVTNGRPKCFLLNGSFVCFLFSDESNILNIIKYEIS